MNVFTRQASSPTKKLWQGKIYLQQSDLSWRAKSLHAYFVGLNNTNVQGKKFRKEMKKGPDTISDFLNELRTEGHITIKSLSMEKCGEFAGRGYVVRELPLNKMLRTEENFRRLRTILKITFELNQN